MPRPALLTDAVPRRFAELGPEDHGDEDDGVPQLFCLVRGLEFELGYVSLEELESARSPLSLGVERDEDWRECSLAELRGQLGPHRGRLS